MVRAKGKERVQSRVLDSTGPMQISTGRGKGAGVHPRPPPRSPVPEGENLSQLGMEVPGEKAPVLQQECP